MFWQKSAIEKNYKNLKKMFFNCQMQVTNCKKVMK
jgi:hypothetical protein